MSTARHAQVYPAAMEQKLRRICRRQLALALVRAALLGTAALLASMLAALIIDRYLMPFHTGVRLLLTASALACAFVTLVAAALRPLRAALGLRRAASDVDQAIPRLEERWTTVAHLVESNHRPLSAIGQVMVRQVTSEAVAMRGLVESACVAPVSVLNSPFLAFSGCAAALALFLGLDWQHHRILLYRFWSPFTEITATQLVCLTGDVVVPRGEQVELVTMMTGLPRATATLVLEPQDGGDAATVELLPHVGQSDQFRYQVPTLESSFRYRVVAGDGRTEWHSVTAIDWPELAEVHLTLTAPDYVGRPVYSKDYLPARLQAAERSRLQLRMRPNESLASFALRIRQHSDGGSGQNEGEATEQALMLQPGSDGWYRYEMTLERDVSLTPDLRSSHGLASRDPPSCHVQVMADRAPTARVLGPTAEMAVTPEDVVEVKFEAHDDHGIARAELIVYEDSPVEGTAPSVLRVEQIPLGNQENSPHVMATARLDLSKYDLRNGARISYAIRVTDNREGTRNGPPSSEPETSIPPAGPVGGADDHPVSQLAARPNLASPSSPDKEKPAAEGVDPASPSILPPLKANSDTGTAGPSSTTSLASGRSDVGGEAGAVDRQAPEATKERGAEAPAAASEEAISTAVAPSRAGSIASEDEKPLSRARTAKSEAFPDSTASPAPDSRQQNTQPQGTGGVVARASDNASSGSQSAAPSVAPAAALPTIVASPTTAAAQPESAPGQTAQPDPSRSAAGSKPGSAVEATRSGSKSGPAGERQTEAPAGSSAAEVAGSESSPPSAVMAKTTRTSSDSGPAGKTVPGKEGDIARAGEGLVAGDLTPITPHPQMTDDLPGQFTESNRLRLTIQEKMISTSPADSMAGGETVPLKVRQRLERIDGELRPVEETLSSLAAAAAQSGLADPQIEALKAADERLAGVDVRIAGLRAETKETAYAFVGLHMVDIGLSHIAPARDRIFTLIRQPDVDPRGNVGEALHRVTRARELLAELLVRFERVVREERLADAIEETAKFYEVYVANLHRFLRAQTRPNPNPLQRRLAIVDVDQEYLDRLREVTEKRRELMAEFARMLADDPRLLAKYMDLLKRRQTSLRDRLTALRERQETLAAELSGWLHAAEPQREDLWLLEAEGRSQDLASLAQEASQFEERTTSQLPLSLDPNAGAARRVVDGARRMAVSARGAAGTARRWLRDPSRGSVDLFSDAQQLAHLLTELDAGLEQLAFDHPDEETTDYTDKRLAEVRSLSERMAAWVETAGHLQSRAYEGLVKVEQHHLASRTEMLRVEMEGIDELVATEFRGQVPESVKALIGELKPIVEGITFTQAAATFELEKKRLEEAEAQQVLALEGFRRAEEKFDEIRRRVVEELDQIDPPDPNIADLNDPTLDEILERLEREPDLNAMLGLPNRPRNLRVLSDFVASLEGGNPVPLAMEQAAEQARRRARAEEAELRRAPRETAAEEDMTEQEWRQVADAEDAQEKLQAKIDELNRRAGDPATDSEEAARLRQMAEQLAQLQQQLAGRTIDRRQWEEMVRSDQMRFILRAAASGEPLPDSQWNRLMSSLGEGLWQVRRRTPPAEFRPAIEQYQERIRKLVNLETNDDRP